MKARVGLLGPKDSVQKIKEIGMDFEAKMDLVPYIYQDSGDISAIIEKHQHSVHFWICSGYTPYVLSQKYHHTQMFFYPKFSDGSITKVLLEISYKDKQNIERISIDSIFRQQFVEMYQELGISTEQMYLYPRSGDTSAEEIFAFHMELYTAGKVNICATGILSVYQRLRAHGVPAYRITATKDNIRQTIRSAYELWEKQTYRQSQIAILMIKIDEIESLAAKDAVSYELHRLDLKIQNTVLDFAETVSGSFMSSGIGRYTVFSTRGSLEQKGGQGLPLLSQLSLITDLASNIGIGYGDSATVAEKNALLALNHAEAFGEFSSFLVDDSGNIEGPLKANHEIGFNYRVTDSELGDKLKQAGVTVSTFNKIISVQKNLGMNALSANDVAEWLKMTQRNARRILTSLEEKGIAKVIGEEAPMLRGRPRKLYQVGFESSDA
ncbi:hypothetical protein ACE3NQ_00270 [Paenibacillus terreus]|uniref:Transcriptional regulator n=1 Tax=Paenibacillus terreus TaxID=1387834 RepID=A0ABV5B0W8_9BACL